MSAPRSPRSSTMLISPWEAERLVRAHNLSPLTRRHLLSNENIGRALRGGIMRYVLLAARHDRTTASPRLLAANRARLAAPDRWSAKAPSQGWSLPGRLAPAPARRGHGARAGDCLGVLPPRPRRSRPACSGVSGRRRPAIRDSRLGEGPATRAFADARRLRRGPDYLTGAQPAGGADCYSVAARICARRWRDAADPLEALFGDGGAAAEALYVASPFARAINQIAAAALDEVLTGRGPVTLLEVGCGTRAAPQPRSCPI